MPARQAITTPDRLNRGDAVSASWLNGILDRVFSAIRFGPGLQGQRMGGQLLISSTATKSTSTAATTTGLVIYTADTKANLTTVGVDAGSIGVTTGALKRGYQFVNGAWICLTHLEAVS